MDRNQERFWSKVLKSEDENACWEWQAYCRRGYGQFRLNGKIVSAHRFAYEDYNNKNIGERMCILHSCDNTKCCNPAHLREGSHQENITDMVNKNRQAHNHGEKSGMSKLTELQVVEIREKAHLKTHQLALEYGVSSSTIGQIINRKIWKHI
jgi:hypothetical protein